MPITEKTDVFLRQASADYKVYNFLDFEYMQAESTNCVLRVSRPVWRAEC